MKLISAMFALALVTGGLVQPAAADKRRCAPVEGSRWMPIEQAIAKSESLGYVVRKAKRSNGCWKLEGFDRQGAKITVYLDPVSGVVVRPTAPPTSAH